MSTLNQMGFIDENDDETVYDLEDSAAQASILAIEGKIPSNASSSNKMATASDITDINNKIPSNASSSNKLVTQSDVASAYHAAGTKTCAELTSALLIAENEGNVYNMSDTGTTTSDFVEGSGKPINLGDDIVVVKVGTNSYKFNKQAGFVDTSGLQTKTLDTSIDVDGTTKTTVESALQAINTLAAGVKTIVGSLSSLTTTVKTSIVAAINELVTSISTINGKIPSGASSSNKMATASDVNAKVSWSDAGKSVKKNLVKNEAVTATVNGLTFTINPDKTVTINGTASANTWFYLNQNFMIPRGTDIKIHGNPSGSNLTIQCIERIDNSTIVKNTQISAGTTAPTQITIDNTTNYMQFLLYIASGKVVSNVTIEPMIYPATILDDTYEPYIPDNTELMTWKANGLLGAKNLIPFPYYGQSKTSSGVTFTVNADGGVTLSTDENGATAQTYLTLAYNDTAGFREKLLKCKDLRLTGGVSNNIWLNFNSPNPSSVNNKDSGNGVIVQFTNISNQFNIALVVEKDTVITTPITVYPLLTLAFDTDSTYQPYAMTNGELTEKVTPIVVPVTTGSKTLTKEGVYKYENIIPVGSSSDIDLPSEMENRGVTIVVRHINVGLPSTNTLQQIAYVNNQGYFFMRPCNTNIWGSWYKFTGTVVS